MWKLITWLWLVLNAKRKELEQQDCQKECESAAKLFGTRKVARSFASKSAHRARVLRYTGIRIGRIAALEPTPDILPSTITKAWGSHGVRLAVEHACGFEDYRFRMVPESAHRGASA